MYAASLTMVCVAARTDHSLFIFADHFLCPTGYTYYHYYPFQIAIRNPHANGVVVLCWYASRPAGCTPASARVWNELDPGTQNVNQQEQGHHHQLI
jgi:hypothetical protein